MMGKDTMLWKQSKANSAAQDGKHFQEVVISKLRTEDAHKFNRWKIVWLVHTEETEYTKIQW